MIDILRVLLPGENAEGGDGEEDGKEEHAADQSDRGTRNHRRRPPGFLRRLRDGFQSHIGDDRQRRSVHELVERRKLVQPLVREQCRVPGEDQPDDNEAGFHDQAERADQLVQQRRFAHPPHIEPHQEENEDERLGRPQGRDAGERPKGHLEVPDRREEKVHVPGGEDGEEGDVDRVVEEQGGSGDESGDIPEAPAHIVLTSARHGVGRGQLGIRQADHDVDQPRRRECEGRRPHGGGDHEPQGRVDVRPHVGEPPHEGAPHRHVAAQALPLRRGPDGDLINHEAPPGGEAASTGTVEGGGRE